MRKIYNYLLAIAFCASVTSCLEEFGSDRPTAIGEEVQFGLSLETPETKTVYGPESGNAFPIYWSEGDKVLVASPQCGKGRNNAEYQVTPVANQSYAKAMTRLGDYGVQWGSSAADFYSIYPSTGATWLDLETENVTAKLNISPQQSANLLLDGNKVYNAADMDNIIMYARTGNVGNGNTVNLNYKPYSTVLEFEMGVSKLANGSYGTATVESMTLTAPEGVAIAGDFTLQFNGNEAPIISASGNNTNRISMVFTTKPILNSENKVCKAKFAVLPIDGIIIGTEKDPWTVSIDVIEGSENQKKTYTKKLKIEAELAPGMIHKITLPKFAPADEWKPSGDSWISSMYEYESIYLTELSIPGAWYAGAPTKDGYQATNQISTLWGAGVRAFAVETRTAVQDIASAFGIGDPETPVSVVVSGTGPNSTGSHPSGLNSLNAGTLSAEEGYKNEAYSYAITDITADDATKISTIIKNIASEVSDTEFAVLILSYADGGKGGTRNLDYGAWLHFINSEVNAFLNDSSIDKAIRDRVYTKEINSNTTVSDVKGSLIIKINVDKNIAKEGYSIARSGNIISGYKYNKDKTYSYNGETPALLSYNPFLSQIADDVDFSTPLFSMISWKTWSDSETTHRKYHLNYNESDFWWCFTSANRTQPDTGTDSSVPTYSDRKAALKAMIDHSREISSNSNHNVWFYFNVGGTEETDPKDKDKTSATNFARTMNPWLYDVIRLKSDGGQDVNGVLGNVDAYIQSDPSPLGIVMFNQCTGPDETYYGTRIINAIIQMNNKFELKRKGYVGDSSVGVDNWDIELL